MAEATPGPTAAQNPTNVPTDADSTALKPSLGAQSDSGAAGGSRGSLDVRSKAISHALEAMVWNHAGVVRDSGGLGRLVGSHTPTAKVDISGHSADVSIRAHVAWPAPVAALAQEIRDEVLARGPELTGVRIRSVDVVLAAASVKDGAATTAGGPGRRVE